MKVLGDMNQCCGCGACINKCPVNAIDMIMNEDGFWEPCIDDNICKKCGACLQVCPIKNEVSGNWDNPKRYAVAAEQEILNVSSSGGAFTLLAEEVLKQGGVVVGAAFTKKFDVNHIIIDDVAQLDQLRLSKYVQSNQKNCYSKTKELLDKGSIVLYSGCPCQIAGLRTFLGKGKSYPNLYTVDLLCHSVPSPQIFKDYLENTWGIDNIENIKMRKTDGWTSCFFVELKDGSGSKQKTQNNIFMKSFHKGLHSRRSCYNCSFARLPRYGDFTIGDMWNAKKLKLGSPYEKKSSLVLINNEHALNLWTTILTNSKHKINLVDLSETTEIKKLNQNVYKPIVTDITRRNTFYENYKKMSYEEAALKTLHPYNIGLVLYMSDNYGSCATNYALYKTIENLGFSPLILDHLVAPEGISLQFAKNNLHLSSGFLEKGDYKAANLLCDSFVIGSDQSMRWDFRLVKKNLEYLLMAFADENKRKIGYAVSFGPERYNLDEKIRSIYSHLLNRFNALSVREDYAINMCKRNFNVDVEWVVDPVFLISKQDYFDIANQSLLELHEPYILVYIRHAAKEKKSFIENVKEQLNIKLIVITDAYDHNTLKQQLGMDDIVDKMEFVDWIAYFANASYIITDSFHGTCLSLIFEKKYISLKAGTTQRFDSLANMLGHGDDPNQVQIFDDTKKLVGKNDMFMELDYDEIRKKIDFYRNQGLEWLNAALQANPCLDETDAEAWLEYAKLAKEKLDNELVKKYGYEEKLRLDRETLIKNGKTLLEAQTMLNDENQYPSDPVTQINTVEEYFDQLKQNNYTIIISVKDDCSVYFEKFLEKSKLKLAKHPKIHNSYIAIIRKDSILYEEVSEKPLQKKFVFNYKNVLNVPYCMEEKDWNEYSAIHTNPLYVKIVSVRWNRELQDQKSIISINNIDYAINKRGINVVVINEHTNRVADSFYIDLHTDSKLNIKRA